MRKLIYILLFLPLFTFGQTPDLLQLANWQQANSGFDADAQAFIDAVGTLTTPQEEAINDLVIGLKANGTWSKHHAIYPFIAGTASSHKWNLKDPRDLDAAFRLTFSGTITHSATGADPDGSTGFANTYYNPSVSGTANNVSLTYYSREDPDAAGQDIGALDGTNQLVAELSWGTGVTKFMAYAASNGAGQLQVAYSGTQAYFQMSRISSSDQKIFKSGSQIATGGGSGNTSPNANVYLFAQNNAGSARYFAQRQCAFATIGLGLTTTEMANDYTVIQAFQTALSRQI